MGNKENTMNFIELMKKLKIEQVAITGPCPNEIINNLKKIGLREWSTDTVVTKGTVFGEEDVTNVAELNFNYDLGFELEVLKYLAGANWHERRQSHRPFLSHIGMHVDTDEELDGWKRIMKGMGIGIAQEVKTLSHTNPIIAGKRNYHYVVFDSVDKLGFDLKLIKRIIKE